MMLTSLSPALILIILIHKTYLFIKEILTIISGVNFELKLSSRIPVRPAGGNPSESGFKFSIKWINIQSLGFFLIIT